jgi:adenine-specific DNA glycosylase
MSASIGEIMKENDRMEEQKKHEVEVKRAYDKFTAENRAPANYIVSSDKIVNFIESMEQIGRDASTTIEISGIDTEAITKSAKIEHNFTHLRAHLEVAGTWENVMRTLTLLENAPYSMVLDDLRLYVDTSYLSAQGGGKDSVKKNTWKLSVNVRALVAP